MDWSHQERWLDSTWRLYHVQEQQIWQQYRKLQSFEGRRDWGLQAQRIRATPIQVSSPSQRWSAWVWDFSYWHPYCKPIWMCMALFRTSMWRVAYLGKHSPVHTLYSLEETNCPHCATYGLQTSSSSCETVSLTDTHVHLMCLHSKTSTHSTNYSC